LAVLATAIGLATAWTSTAAADVLFPPETYIDSPTPPDPSSSRTAQFHFHASEAGTFDCSLDGGGFSPCSDGKTYHGLLDGQHTFEVAASDFFLHTDSSPASYAWTIDATAPTVSITGSPPDPSNSTSASFSFTSDDSGATFACQLDGGGYSSCDSGTQSYSGLTETTHIFQVRATDSLGNTGSAASYTWTVDATAPTATITGNPSNPTGSTTAQFNFTSDDSSATFLCQLDGGGFSGCSSGKTYTGLSSGSHTFQVRARDAAGNTGSADSYTWMIDSAPPTATITSFPPNPSTSQSASFNFTADKSGSTFECQLDGGGFSGCTSGITYSGLSEANHTFEVRATDSLGNTGSADSYSWRVDVTAPTATITSFPPNPTSSTSASFNYSSNDPGASFECQLDGGGFSSCSASGKSYSGLTVATHEFQVRAKDNAGNTGSADSYTWTIDNTGPTVTITNHPSDPTGSTSASFSFTSSKPGSTFACQLDGGGVSACNSGSQSYSSLSPGSHTFQVRATDGLGNTGAPASFTWTIDTSTPSVTITSHPADPTSSTTASFGFTASKPGSTFACQLDGGGFSACNSGVSYAGLSSASHTFQVRATDTLGNTGPAASFSWAVDTTPPETTIISGPAPITTSHTATFSFSSSEGGSTFQCRLDSGAYESCASGKQYTGVGDGTHTFYVHAIDSVGNTDASDDSLTWTVDSAEPNTTIDSGPVSPTKSQSASFTFSSTKTGSTFQCKLDSGSFAACNSGQTYNSVGEGTHSFSVRAIDPLGTADSSPAIYVWTIDLTPPNTTIDSGPSGITGSGSASFSFSSTENNSTFECQLDGNGFAPCISPQPYNVSDGSHTFSVRAIDEVGNVDGSPASSNWTVVTTAPDTFIDSGPPSLTGDNTPSFTFHSNESAATFECQLSGPGQSAGYSGCASGKTYSSGLADGTYTFSVRAKNAVNTDQSPATSTFTVDTAAPTVTITSGPEGLINTNSAAYEFTSSEPGATFQCLLNGADFTPCTSPAVYTSIPDGSYTFRVRAVDQLGHASALATRAIQIDTTPPTTSIDSGPSDPTADDTPTFTFSGTGNPVGFECRIDGAAFAPCPTPYTTPPLTNARHTLDVRSVDAAGNYDPSPASRSFTVDTGFPDTIIDSGPPPATSNPSVSFFFHADKPVNGFECELTGPGQSGGFVACTAPKAYTLSGDGTYTFAVRAIGVAGADTTPATSTFTLDRGAPGTNITAGPAQGSLTNINTASFEFTSTEPVGATFQCKLDGATFSACTSPASYGPLADGQHTFRVRAVDQAGNVDQTEAQRSWTIDTIPSDTFISASPPASTNNKNPSFSFFGDPGSTFECQLIGPGQTGVFAACPSPNAYSNLADGAYTFSVRAKDPAQNVDPTPATYPFTVDTIAPVVTIESGPTNNGTSSSPSVQFTFRADDPNATFVCKVSNSLSDAYSSCTPPASYSLLEDGKHIFSVKATDLAGNGSAEVARTWFIDTGPPDTIIDAGPSGPTNDSTPTYAFSSNEPRTTYVCKVEGPGQVSGFNTCTSPLTVAPLGDGSYTFYVQAIDVGGLPDPTPAKRSFRVDTAPPETSIKSSPADLSPSTAATFDFGATEADSSYQCRLDGGSWAGCQPRKVYADLSVGRHAFEVRATDAAGNVDPSPAGKAWTIQLPAAATASVPRLISPFPIVRIAGSLTRNGVRLRLFLVNTPAGSKVTVRCKGASCPFSKRSRAASNAIAAQVYARAAKVVRIRTLEKHIYRAGVRIEVFVTKPGMIGKYTRFKIRKGKAPARIDRCLMPGSTKPVRCS
jgi:hypothetical protein